MYSRYEHAMVLHNHMIKPFFLSACRGERRRPVSQAAVLLARKKVSFEVTVQLRDVIKLIIRETEEKKCATCESVEKYYIGIK